MSERNIHIGGDADGGNIIVAGDGNVIHVHSQSIQQARTDSPEKSADPPSGISGKKPLVYLCHAKEDAPAVKNLYDKLQQNGCDPWMNEIDLSGGQDESLEIKKTLKNADFVIVCLSTQAVRKAGKLHKEVRWASDYQDEMPPGEIFLIPVRLDDCEPPLPLSHLHCVDLFAPYGFEKLLKSLMKRR